MRLTVDAQLIGKKLHRLEIKHEGHYIGEYERSQADDIDRKTEEILCAAELLLKIFHEHGEFKVRWNGERGQKIIYAAEMERGVVPKRCWRPPSWSK